MLIASLQRSKPLHEYPGYEPKPSDGEASVLELCATQLISGPLKPKLVVSVGVPSMGQIELFNHLLYVKPFNYAQIND